VDVVDETDKILYQTSLEECKTKGLLHRSVAVFFLNLQNEILLQQRSMEDDWLPGKWTASSTGHVKAGENPTRASIRELQEELGILAHPTFLFKELLPEIHWSNQAEYEIAYVFEARSDSKIKMDSEEVEQVKFMSKAACRSFVVGRPEDLTPDAVILLQKYLHGGYV